MVYVDRIHGIVFRLETVAAVFFVVGFYGGGVVEAAKHGPFSSRENFKLRAKISGTVVEKMAEMGILGDLPETDQMSLLDFMA